MSVLTILQPDARVTPGRFADWLAETEVPYRTMLAGVDPLPQPDDCRGVIVLGGHMGVGDSDQHPFLLELQAFMRRLVEESHPLLGICLGGQLLAAATGGKVTAKSRGERGVTAIMQTGAGGSDRLFAGLPQPFLSFQWHNDSFDPPDSALHLAATATCPGQAFRVGSCAYGLQFHPEVDETMARDWSERGAASPVYLEEFLRQRPYLEAASRKLLDNFLRML